MTKRWEISTDGGLTFLQIVNPINTHSIKFSWTRNLKGGEIFFRCRLTGPLRFKGEDFDFFRSWERTGVRRCNTIYIRQKRLCSGQWKRFWTGRFSVGAGKFDFDACEFEVKPEVFDRYSCILDHLSDKVNLMDIEPGIVNAVIFPANLEFAACPFDFSPELCGIQLITEGWAEAELNIPLCVDNINLYYRERSVTNCVAGSPVEPPGSGWILLENNCAVDGTATYVRLPTVSWTFSTPTITYTEAPDSTPVPPDEPGCSSWIYLTTYPASDLNGTIACLGPDPAAGEYYVHFWICSSDGTPITYRRSRGQMESLEYMLERAGCDVSAVVSDFFEWNPIGDAPGYVAGENYITGETNTVSNIQILQKSDAIDPLATNPATIGEMTIAEMFQWLRALQVFWDIDDSGRLRLEHWHFWNYSQGLDLTTGEAYELNRGMNRYEHLSQEIPGRERCTMAEANGPDFVGLDIIYDSPCVQVDERNSVEETKLGFITTDISFISTTPDAISTSGFVMLACDSEAIPNVIIDTGAITGVPTTNAPLSWANIHAAFWTWNRYLKQGNMNGEDVTFDGIVPNIQQPDLKAPFCCGMEAWDPRDTVKTELGQRFLNNRNAFVEKAEMEDYDDRLSITPRYAY